MGEFNTVQAIVNFFDQMKPVATKRDLDTQLGVHVEEVSEMLLALSLSNQEASILKTSTEAFADKLKSGEATFDLSDPENKLEFVDAMVDQIVTAIGVLHYLGVDVDGALKEVNASNYSKFVQGVATFDINGKMLKGPKYFKPDFSKYY
jgi:predicted HAD superfamily Cof-like phosphohydrolase